ncbi:cyclase family protein [Paenarthrobacter nicotinovorans]|uniref:cyclase family protein n=1 Tax=Paenarthrobacter nicotinovorans TaxID=29320 RepID=UPI00382503E1
MIDLNRPLEDGVETFPGFPTPVMRHHISYDDSRGQIAEGREFCADLITLVGGSATYMDAPRHMDRNGTDVAGLPLDRLVDVPAIVVRAPKDRREFLPADFIGLPLEGHAVLLATGWDRHWGSPAYATASPYLGPEAAHYLVQHNIALVGIDAILVDDIDDASPPLREAHVSLLGAGIPIIENMVGLTSLPPSGARLTAVPPAVKGVGSFPVRAFASLPN